MRKRLHNTYLLIAGIALVLYSACSDKREAGVIPPDKMEDILYDYHLIQAIVNDMPPNERYKKELYFEYLYSKHGVNAAEIDSSLVYYARYPKDLAMVYEKLSSRLEQEIQHIEKENVPITNRTAQSVTGDSANLWYDAILIELTPSPISNRYQFTIPTDTNFHLNDCIEWSGHTLFLQESSDSLSGYLHLSLLVKYANDTSLAADTLLYASGNFTLQVTDTTGVMVRSVEGTAYYKESDAKGRVLMIHPELMRYHTAKCDSTSPTPLGVATPKD